MSVSAGGVSIEFTDNSNKTKAEIEEAIKRALTKIGITAENHAVDNIRSTVKQSKGTLANSIDSKVVDDTVYVGSNLEYAIYNEFGTGVYGENKTSGYWVYVSGSESKNDKAKGKRYSLQEAKKIVHYLREKGLEAYYTQGMKPKHFLKKAVQDHVSEYQQIMNDELGKA